MKTPKTGGQVFPLASDVIGHWPGMSLRDWYAGQALVGYLAAHAGPGLTLPHPGKIALDCYFIADAMIAESEK